MCEAANTNAQLPIVESLIGGSTRRLELVKQPG